MTPNITNSQKSSETFDSNYIYVSVFDAVYYHSRLSETERNNIVGQGPELSGKNLFPDIEYDYHQTSSVTISQQKTKAQSLLQCDDFKKWAP